LSACQCVQKPLNNSTVREETAQHLDTLALGEPHTNAKGGKSAQVTLQNGKPVVCIATFPLSCPYGAGLYQDDGGSTRLNIDFGQLEGLEAIYRGLDEQLIQAATTAKESFWHGKKETPGKNKQMAQHLETLALGEVRVNAKGGRSAQVTHQSGKPVVVVTTVPLSCPFGAVLYQDDGSSTRLNIDFGQLEGLEAVYRGLDEQLIQAAINAKESLWPGKNLTDQQVRENYTSPLKEREGYSATLRCKIDTEKCRFLELGGGEDPAARLESQGLPGLSPHPAPVPLVYGTPLGRHVFGDGPAHPGTVDRLPLVSALRCSPTFGGPAKPSTLKENSHHATR
jgi:hypothetical protein